MSKQSPLEQCYGQMGAKSKVRFQVTSFEASCDIHLDFANQFCREGRCRRERCRTATSNTRLVERNYPPATAPAQHTSRHPPLPTPIHVSELQHLLQGYPGRAKDRLITGVTEGFKIHFHGEIQRSVVDDILRADITRPCCRPL